MGSVNHSQHAPQSRYDRRAPAEANPEWKTHSRRRSDSEILSTSHRREPLRRGPRVTAKLSGFGPGSQGEAAYQSLSWNSNMRLLRKSGAVQKQIKHKKP